MTSAREHILATLRRGLKRGELSDKQRAELEARLANPPRNLIPARALLSHPEQVELFVKMAVEAAATVERVADSSMVPGTVVAFLEKEGIPKEVVMAPAEELEDLPWESIPGLKIQRRRAQQGDRVSITPAFAGIAETGTLMLLSGPHSPTTLNFLPDIHIAILDSSRIVGPYEDAWAMLREQGLHMPRTINLITGPSRSADIEQKLQMGAHGPIQLHIVLVGKELS